VNYLQYLIVRGILAGLQCIPYETALRLATSVARFAYAFDPKPRERAIANLRLIFGDAMSDDRRCGLAFGALETICRHIAEVAHITRQRDRNLVIENGGLVKDAYKAGRGVVAVSAHMGPFVRMAMVPTLLGIKVAAVMKKQQNEVLLQWGRDFVKRNFDINTFLKVDARDQIESLLREGYLVGLFADQHPRKGGFPCSFFGRPILAAAGPAVYAKRTGAPLVFVSAVTKADGTHVMRWEGPISTEGTHEEVSQRWVSLLEARIREYPEQWTWMHRRWRDRHAPDIREVAEAAIKAAT
jgi:KDO2-lipid IV(A) lauroyltransferase